MQPDWWFIKRLIPSFDSLLVCLSDTCSPASEWYRFISLYYVDIVQEKDRCILLWSFIKKKRKCFGYLEMWQSMMIVFTHMMQVCLAWIGVHSMSCRCVGLWLLLGYLRKTILKVPNDRDTILTLDFLQSSILYQGWWWNINWNLYVT